jgi:inosose dehydratase
LSGASRPRLAGAPISWGVSEVPGWGHQMAAERVLREMRAVGLTATELGPPGFLPATAEALGGLLAASGLRLAAGFAAAVLHVPARRADTLAQLESAAGLLAAAGADVLVVAAASAAPGYDRREALDAAGWAALAEGLRRAEDVAARHGLELAFHPHVGTLVEGREEVSRFLEVTGAGLCLDTGHLLAGGSEPLQVAGAAGARVRHVHLKDVDGALAGRVRRGELAFSAAVRSGLFRPLGEGAVDLAGLRRSLDAAGYGGWYVLERDVSLEAEPPPGGGPIVDVGRSVEAFGRLVAGVAAAQSAGREDGQASQST